MIAALAAAAFVTVLILILVTLVQTFYLESLRLRTREVPAQQYFKEHLDERLGYKAEAGALTYSLIKHSLLPVLGVLVLATGGGVLQSIAIAWLTMLFATYVVPQFLYRRTTCAWLVPLVPLLRFSAFLVRPLTALTGFVQSLAQSADHDTAAAEMPTAEENIDALITAGAEEGIIEEEDRKLIQSAAAFGSKTVREVMTPRPAIVAISADASLAELRQLVINEQFSRIPVYDGNIDNILGFIHVRDMFELEGEERQTRRVRDLMRPIAYVPETKPVDDLLRDMQQEGNHMAVVIDEYGNTAGLVTMEDMVEEIVGEIRDEHEPAMDIQADGTGAWIVSGSFDIDRLQDLLHYRPEDTESTTVGGLITEWAGHVPAVGEAVVRDGIRLEVLSGSELRVDQVRISRPEASVNGQ